MRTIIPFFIHLNKNLAESESDCMTISNRGNPSLSSIQLVEIEIYDRNDELPQFESFSTQESVLENRPIGYSIGTFGRTNVDLTSTISASLTCNYFKNDQIILRPGFI